MSKIAQEDTMVAGSVVQPLEFGRSIAISLIDPNPYQPRHQVQDADLEDLTASVRQNGILQSLLVRPNGDRFHLIAGFRRLSAAKLAGLAEVPCLVREMTDSEMAQFALIENLQRSDLNPVEEAEAIDHLRNTNKLDQKGIAELINKSVGFVSERTSLLKLSAEIKGLVASGQLPIRKAIEISKISKPETQHKLAEKADRFGLEDLRELVQRKLEKEKAGRKRYEKHPVTKDLRGVLRDLPGVRVYKDRVSFTFDNEEELIATVRKLLEQLTSEF